MELVSDFFGEGQFPPDPVKSPPIYDISDSILKELKNKLQTIDER